MEISSSSSLIQALTVVRSSGEPQNWKPGQIVEATVISTVKNNLVKLQIGATILTAQVKAELQPGQKLNLEIITAGEKPVAIATPQNTDKIAIETVIRQALANQQSHSQLLNNLSQLINSEKQLAKLPIEIQAAVKKVLQLIPDKNVLRTAESVKQAIKNSGIFLEARLNSPSSTALSGIQQDFKAALLRLQQVVSQHPEIVNSNKQTTTESARLTYARPTTNTANISSPAATNTTNTSSPAATPGSSQSSQVPVAATQANSTLSVTNNNIQTTTTTAIQNRLNSTINQISTRQTSTVTNNVAPASSAPATPVKATSSLPLPPLTTTPINSNSVNTPSAQTSEAQRAGSQPSLQTLLGRPGATPTTASPVTRTEAPLSFTSAVPYRSQQAHDDIKAAQRFAKLDSLGKILVQLLKDADSSLARIQLNQLGQQHIEPELKQAWNFEIPVRHDNKVNMFEFNIKKDNKQTSDDDETSQGWSIQISFDMEPLGQVHSKIALLDKQVSITFWAEQQQTTDTFRDHIKQLQEELVDAGLEIEQIICIQGHPPQDTDEISGNIILDEKA